MKFFCVCLFIFFATISRGQVTVPDEVARFFLAKNEQLKEVKIQNELLRQDIGKLEKQVLVLNSIIGTYTEEQDIYMKQIQILRERLIIGEAHELELEKEIKKLTRQKNFWKVCAPVMLVLGFVIGVT